MCVIRNALTETQDGGCCACGVDRSDAHDWDERAGPQDRLLRRREVCVLVTADEAHRTRSPETESYGVHGIPMCLYRDLCGRHDSDLISIGHG